MAAHVFKAVDLSAKAVALANPTPVQLLQREPTPLFDPLPMATRSNPVSPVR